ncbi:MAG: T9SS type A sorting domain-containing protein [Bacteroidales bacterium]|nr:T9SS type A sorting domain-containing protein [Bacteroidales bacterium]
MPVDSIPDKLSGYYKYFAVGPDTALGGLTLYHYNVNTGNTELLEEAFTQLPPADDYTYFEIEVDYFSLPEPDTMNIAFASGNVDEESIYIGLGSVLYVDALEITYKPNLVGVKKHQKEITHQVYPNPASNKIYIEFQDILKNDISVTVSNSMGTLVYQKKINPLVTNQLDISVQNFTPGLYFYIIESGKNSFKGKFIVQ